MKIRAIELDNVRRFAGQRAQIDHIGDGITVLSEPNEFGKSTFFDALHATFFERHRSTKAPVKALQPHAGGAPEVRVTIEIPDGRFSLRKRWLSRATAQVFDSAGRLLAQDDEAEAWIDRLLGQGLAGPSGLLWVRQGMVGMEPEGTSAAEKNEREQSLGARRDLLSSVAGEIEMMTGGRRMDIVLARVREDIARIATSTLRPKADGDWKRATDEVQRLAQQRDDLATKAQTLSSALMERGKVVRDLARINDPQDAAARQSAVVEAQKAHETAQAHAARIETARQALKLADVTLTSTKAEVTRLSSLLSRISQARAAVEAAALKAGQVDAMFKDRQQAETAAATVLAEMQAVTGQLRQRVVQAQKAKASAEARLRAADLRQALQRAEAQRDRLSQIKAARALIRTTEPAVQAVEAAKTARDRLALRIEAQSATVSFAYTGALRALQEGRPIEESRIHITAPTRFDLPGLGHLTISPGEQADTALGDLSKAEHVLVEKLLACDAADLAEAQARLAEARRLDGEILTATAVLQNLAPKGIDALHQSLAEAEATAGAASDEPEDATALSQSLGEAEATEAAARADAEEARTLAVAAGRGVAAAQADVVSTKATLAAAEAEAGDSTNLARQLAKRSADVETQQADRNNRQADLDALVAAAPDIETTLARLKRVESAETQARAQREQFQNDLSRLNGFIGSLADEGIEEVLDDVTGKLAAAEARAQRYQTEVLALDRLRTALETARRAARDAYFGPVLRELEPLLAILHPGAHLQIDDQSLLPKALTRNGREESLEILSGGTREQVAILTRLAFARLFAASGRDVPVILDDALVHSDDDRIEAMFTALHRVARDQQIIVLTCRQRAFAGLGGARARVSVEAL